MYIPQYQLKNLKNKVAPGKVVIVYGARRTGKTTLLNHYLQGEKNYLLLNGEEIHTQDYLSSRSVEKLKALVGNAWSQKKVQPPKIWSQTYPEATFTVVNQENYLSFITR